MRRRSAYRPGPSGDEHLHSAPTGLIDAAGDDAVDEVGYAERQAQLTGGRVEMPPVGSLLVLMQEAWPSAATIARRRTAARVDSTCQVLDTVSPVRATHCARTLAPGDGQRSQCRLSCGRGSGSTPEVLLNTIVDRVV